jgi:hypothetical protein
MGAELFYAERQTDRQTDRHEQDNSRFNNFAKAPKMIWVFSNIDFEECEIPTEVLPKFLLRVDF